MTTVDSLQGSVDDARDELRRADAKAQTALTLVGAAFAGVVALTRADLPPVPELLLWVASAPIAVSVLVLLSVICPYLGAGEPGSFLHAARSTPDDLVALHAASEVSAVRVATTLTVISRLARRKYRRTQVAMRLLTCGLGLLLAALVVVALSGGA